MLNSVYFLSFYKYNHRESSAQMQFGHLEMTVLLYRAFYVHLTANASNGWKPDPKS